MPSRGRIGGVSRRKKARRGLGQGCAVAVCRARRSDGIDCIGAISFPVGASFFGSEGLKRDGRPFVVRDAFVPVRKEAVAFRGGHDGRLGAGGREGLAVFTDI